MVVLRNTALIDLHVRASATAGQREDVLLRWHRAQLKAMVPPLLDKWQPLIGVQVAHWGGKKMKTKWAAATLTRGASG